MKGVMKSFLTQKHTSIACLTWAGSLLVQNISSNDEGLAFSVVLLISFPVPTCNITSAKAC